MTTDPSSNGAPQAVLKAIQEYLDDLGQYFGQHGITYSATCDVAAGTSVDNIIWSAGAQPGTQMFVGSAIKTFILGEYLRSDLSEATPTVIDDGMFAQQLRLRRRDPRRQARAQPEADGQTLAATCSRR